MEFLRYLLDILFPPRSTEALVREATIESIGRFLAPQVVESCMPHATALLPYRNPSVRALILEAKYKDHAHAQEVLGRMLAEYLSDHASEQDAFESSRIVLVPVPLGRARRTERGYNQVERILLRAMHGAPEGTSLAPDLLTRVRDTLPQTSLRRDARKKNVAGAFRTLGPVEPSHTYIVVDDVITTGTTLQAACDALSAAGARNVMPLALAH